MALDQLPVSARATIYVSGFPEHGYQNVSAFARSLFGGSGGRVALRLVPGGAAGARTLTVGVADTISSSARLDFPEDIEQRAVMRIVTSTGVTVYEGGFGGDDADPYVLPITDDAYAAMPTGSSSYLTFNLLPPSDVPLEIAAALPRPYLVPPLGAPPLAVGIKPPRGLPPRLAAPPLGIAAASPAPSVYRGIHGLDLKIGASLPRARLYTNFSAPPLGIAAELPAPALFDKLHPRDTGVAVELLRPRLFSLHPRDLGVGVTPARPRLFTPVTAAAIEVAILLTGPRLPFPQLDAPALRAGIALPSGFFVSYAERFRIAERASAARDTILTAIEINHPSAFSPFRIVNDTESRTIGGLLFARSRFEAKLLDDYDRRAPRASIVVANTGRELSDWFEQTGGGAGATVRILQAVAIDNAAIDWEMTLDVADVQIDTARVTGRLGFDPLLGRPAVEMRYDPETAPGLF